MVHKQKDRTARKADRVATLQSRGQRAAEHDKPVSGLTHWTAAQDEEGKEEPRDPKQDEAMITYMEDQIRVQQEMVQDMKTAEAADQLASLDFGAKTASKITTTTAATPEGTECKDLPDDPDDFPIERIDYSDTNSADAPKSMSTSDMITSLEAAHRNALDIIKASDKAAKVASSAKDLAVSAEDLALSAEDLALSARNQAVSAAVQLELVLNTIENQLKRSINQKVCVDLSFRVFDGQGTTWEPPEPTRLLAIELSTNARLIDCCNQRFFAAFNAQWRGLQPFNSVTAGVKIVNEATSDEDWLVLEKPEVYAGWVKEEIEDGTDFLYQVHMVVRLD